MTKAHNVHDESDQSPNQNCFPMVLTSATAWAISLYLDNRYQNTRNNQPVPYITHDRLDTQYTRDNRVPVISLDLLLMIANVICAWLYLYTKAQPENSSDGQPWFGSIWTSRFKSRNILIFFFLSESRCLRDSFRQVGPRAESHLSSMIPWPDEQGVTNRLGWSSCCVNAL